MSASRTRHVALSLPLSLAGALCFGCQGAPYPILLAHGMAGWDQIGSAWNYFYLVAADLESRGERVYTSQVSPFDDSTVRGAELAKNIDTALAQFNACKINIIAHSQGGIDARYAISTAGRGGRIASLVTVATPHRGTPVADVALGLVPGIAYPVVDAVLLAYQAIIGAPPGSPGLSRQLKQLSTSVMQDQFNVQNPDDPRVAYYSVAGRSDLAIDNKECQDAVWPNSQRGDVLGALFGPVQIVFNLASPDPLVPLVNDGLVNLDSARWGRFLGCEPADHIKEIGQILLNGTDPISGFNHIDLYRQIVDQIHGDGF
jgi:triacylglycerol lipase